MILKNHVDGSMCPLVIDLECGPSKIPNVVEPLRLPTFCSLYSRDKITI